MKRLTKIFFAVAALAVGFSCTTDTTEDLSLSIKGGGTELAISLEESRTQLGEKADGLYPLYWSEGDKIAVNGVASTALTAEEAGAAGALFTFESELVRPYNIVYPAPAEGVAALTEGQYPVTFLAEQEYTAGTFCAGAAPMYGYAAAETEGAIQLQHLTGVLRFAVKGEGVTLKQLAITSETGALAGTFDVDCATGALTAHDDASNTIKVTFGKGLTLGAEATPIYVAVPAGKYGKIYVMISSDSDIMKLTFDSEAKPLNAGAVREFAEFTYAANSSESDIYVIDSKEALIHFAEIAANFAPYTTAKVVAPIDMTGVEWAPVEGFGGYIFDGGEFEIKGLSAPLFGSTAAHIKNVKLTDVAMEITEDAFSGAIACKLLGGSLNNCSAAGTYNINNTTLVLESFTNQYNDIGHGGLVGRANGATIYNCTNNLDITATSFCAADFNCKVTFGGLVGVNENGSKYNNLTNNGDIVYNGTTQIGNIYASGIIGKSSDVSGQGDMLELSNCTNNGIISTTADSKCSGSMMMAGITGTTSKVKCVNLKNYADITHNGKCGTLYQQGIISYNTYADFDQCENTGNLTASTGAEATQVYQSGLFAKPNSSVITNCNNSGNLTVGDISTLNGYVKISGLIDTLTGEGASMTNCNNSGKISAGAITNAQSGNSGRLYMAGLISTLNHGDISDCHNLAEATINSTAKDMASMHMVGGLFGYIASASIVDQKINVTDCTQNATITLTPESCVSTYCGGLVGQHWANKANLTVTFTRVVNNGAVSILGKDYTSSTSVCVGGMFGNLNSEANFVDCHNNGAVTVKPTGDVTSLFVGGFMGYNCHRTDDSPKSSSFTDCSNKAKVVFAPATVTANAYAGGFIGYGKTDSNRITAGEEIDKYTRCYNSGDVEVSGDGTLVSLWVGSFIGYLGQGSVVTDCYTGSDVTVDVSISNITTGLFVGWTGRCVHVKTGDWYKFERCYNESNFNIKSKNMKTLHLSGLIGASGAEGSNGAASGSGTYEITNCRTKAIFNMTGKTTDGMRYGGLCVYPYGSGSTYTIKNFTNENTVNITGTIGKNIEAGGLGGYVSATLIVDADTEIKENVTISSTLGTYLGYGGYWGNLNHSGVTDKYEGTYSGTLTATGTVGTNVVVGGIAAQHKAKINLDNTVFKGNLIFGTPEKPFVSKGDYFRVGGISCGGATSYDSNNLVHVMNNVTSAGKITIQNATISGTALVGGFWGHCPSVTNGCTSACEIQVIGTTGINNIGMFSGSARSATSLATNCKIGGKIATTTTKYEDSDGVEVVGPLWVELSDTNFFDYMYGGTTDWTGVENYDGCSFLSVVPEV